MTTSASVLGVERYTARIAEEAFVDSGRLAVLPPAGLPRAAGVAP